MDFLISDAMKEQENFDNEKEAALEKMSSRMKNEKKSAEELLKEEKFQSNKEEQSSEFNEEKNIENSDNSNNLDNQDNSNNNSGNISEIKNSNENYSENNKEGNKENNEEDKNRNNKENNKKDNEREIIEKNKENNNEEDKNRDNNENNNEENNKEDNEREILEESEESNKENEEIEQKINPNDFVKWFSELNKNSGKIVGGKGANLAEIYNLGISVPPGFVVTAQAYDYFIEVAGIKDKINELLNNLDYEDTEKLNEVTKQIRAFIIDSDMPDKLEKDILESYEHLNIEDSKSQSSNSALDILNASAEPGFVAVRSSATTEDLADASFAGQQDTYLNIKGKDKLLRNIKKCFASLFTSRATYYRNKKGFPHDKSKLAVVVQKMIDSDKSGVMFSKDPSNRTDNIIIESVWGLGEGIVSGRVTPDKYELSEEFELIDKKIANKKVAITRNAAGEKSVVRLNSDIAQREVLRKHELMSLAEIAIKLEKHYKKPQDIEFAIEGEEVYIVQTRPITTLSDKLKGQKIPELEGEVIVSGLAASPGIAAGKVKIIEDLKDLGKIKQGDILVTEMTNPDMVVAMQKSAAVITDEGGLTAHAAIVSREMGIPSVVGIGDATKNLTDGEMITVDGYSGKIYRGKLAESEKKEVLPVENKTKTNLKVIVDLPNFAERASKTNLKKVGLTRIEGIIAESGKHPNYFVKNGNYSDYEDIVFKGLDKISEYFEEMWVRTSDIRSDEYQNLEGAPEDDEANPMLGMHGIRYGLKYPEILKSEIKALEKIANKGKKVGLLISQLVSVNELKEVKKIVNEIGYDNLKIGIMIETPAAIQEIKSFVDEGIDFISFGTNDLTQYFLAVDRGNDNVQYLYDEMNPGMLKQMQYVLRVCKRNQVETSICGQAGSKKSMVKFLIENEIDSISVNADKAKEISDYVYEIENDLIKGTDKEPRNYNPEKNQDNNSNNNSLNNNYNNNNLNNNSDNNNNNNSLNNNSDKNNNPNNENNDNNLNNNFNNGNNENNNLNNNSDDNNNSLNNNSDNNNNNNNNNNNLDIF